MGALCVSCWAVMASLLQWKLHLALDVDLHLDVECVSQRLALEAVL